MQDTVSDGPDAGETPRATVRRQYLAGIAIVAMTLAAYVPAMRGGFIWDDTDYVLNNQTLRSVEGLGRIWFELGATRQYYPLVFTTFWMEYRVWGLAPFGYHAVNVVLHAIAAVLLWRVLRFLAVPGAWPAAALFALHPVHVESVAWITERKNVLSTVLYFGAALAYLRYALGPQRRSTVALYAAAIVLYIAALLSKSVTCSLPAALLLVLWWQRDRFKWADGVRLAPFLLAGVVSGWLTVWMEKVSVGAAGEAWNLSFMDRCAVAGRALWFYAGKLLWPSNLTFVYPRWPLGVWWHVGLAAAAVAVMIGLWLARRRVGRGPLVAVSFFAGTLFPALGFFDVYPMQYSFVADHFQYLASVGLLVLFCAVGTLVLRRLGRGAVWPGAVVTGAILGTAGFLTFQHGRVYADIETLWRDTIAKNSTAWMAHNNLGNELFSQGRIHEAIKEYRAALRIRPDRAPTHNNLGIMLTHLGALENAIARFREALRIDRTLPGAHANLADVLVIQGRFGEAMAQYDEELRLRPRWPLALRGIAWILAVHPDPHQRRPEKAVALARRAATHDPYHQRSAHDRLAASYAASILDTLAAAQAATGEFDGAVSTAQEALTLARAGNLRTLVSEIEERLHLYKEGRPYVAKRGGR